MTDLTAIEAGENFLEHYGVLGMKWGRTKADGNSAVKKARSDDKAARKESKLNFEQSTRDSQSAHTRLEASKRGKSRKVKKAVDVELKKLDREYDGLRNDYLNNRSKKADLTLEQRDKRDTIEALGVTAAIAGVYFSPEIIKASSLAYSLAKNSMANAIVTKIGKNAAKATVLALGAKTPVPMSVVNGVFKYVP